MIIINSKFEKTRLFIDRMKSELDSEEIMISDYINLYKQEGDLKIILAYFHKKLNSLFLFMNSKFIINKHYNADDSRKLIYIIDKIKTFKSVLSLDGVDLFINEKYQKHIEFVSVFLSPSGGSVIPEDYQKIEIIEYEQIFVVSSNTIKKKNLEHTILKTDIIGEGAFAIVSSYQDMDYDKKFAMKKLKKTKDERVVERFCREFKILKSLSFPYILEVYYFFSEENKYTMEYCHTDLKEYINKNNQKLSVATRKRMILQFLYAINYLHSKNILHRDISYRNVLIKIYDNNVPIIKLSDFGLVKIQNSEFTKSETEIKGSIVDPSLDNFKNYSEKHEIYAIGHVIYFIASGKESINVNKDNKNNSFYNVSFKCISQDHTNRYNTVKEIICDVENIQV